MDTFNPAEVKKDPPGWDALYTSIFKNDIVQFKRVLKAHPGLATATDPTLGRTMLYELLESNLRMPQIPRIHEMIDLLLQAGADINAHQPGRRTPLGIQTFKKENESGEDLSVAEHLIARGASLLGKDPHDTENWSILHLAIDSDHTHFVELLARRGGQEILENQGPGGVRPLHRTLMTQGHPDIPSPILGLECMRILLRAGADVHALTAEGHSAIDMARENGLEEAAMVLVAHGAPAKQGGEATAGHTMLTAAAACDDVQRILEIDRTRRLQKKPLSAKEMDLALGVARDSASTDAATLIESLVACQAVDQAMAMAAKSLRKKNARRSNA